MTKHTKIKYNSGVIPVPIYTKPHHCGGECIYCPKKRGFPNSYLDNEDTLFAKTNDYSSVAQFTRFQNRLGNSCQDIYPFEIIVLGGSFSSLDKSYRAQFLSELYNEMLEAKQHTNIAKQGYVKPQCLPSVVTVESRPDQINKQECDFLRQIGVSKVELGIQHTSDEILKFNKRGHDQSTVVRATRLLKDEGFKVGYHIMVGLPSANFNDDYKMLSTTLWEDGYSPDFLKIYPCILLSDPLLQPELVRLYETGKWRPLDYKSLVKLLYMASNKIPSYVRISRIQRQFDNKLIRAGVKHGLRCQLDKGFTDIRAREVGKLSHKIALGDVEPINTRIMRQAKDMYIEIIGKDSVLLGYLRLRILKNKQLMIRELKVLGEASPIGSGNYIQGKGLGSQLLNIVESIGLSMEIKKVFVNASPGARPYFIKYGYESTISALLVKQLVHKSEDNKLIGEFICQQS